jgi:hypothetical protein
MRKYGWSLTLRRPLVVPTVIAAVAVALLGLSVIGGGSAGASRRATPSDRATCADLGAVLHDSAAGLNVVGAIGTLVRAGETAHDATIRRAAQVLLSNSSPASDTAALKAIGSACSRLGTPSNPNDLFVLTLRHFAPEVTLADAIRFEGLGRAICSDLRRGATISDEVNYFSQQNLATDVADGVLVGGVFAYCPRFERQLQAFAGG